MMRYRRVPARLARAAVVVLVAPVVVAAAPVVAAQDDAGEEIDVRITVQRHDDDYLEFGLQLRIEDEPWSDRVLPDERFLPPRVPVGPWLISSAVTVRLGPPPGEAGAEAEVGVRIAARRIENSRVEFALQRLTPGEGWSERLRPARRLFPMHTEVGRWLVSSPLTVGLTEVPAAGDAPAEAPDEGSDPTEGEPSTAGATDNGEPAEVEVSADVLDFDMIDVRTGETMNIRSVVNGETPLLFWLWSPY